RDATTAASLLAELVDAIVKDRAGRSRERVIEVDRYRELLASVPGREAGAERASHEDRSERAFDAQIERWDESVAVGRCCLGGLEGSDRGTTDIDHYVRRTCIDRRCEPDHGKERDAPHAASFRHAPERREQQ